MNGSVLLESLFSLGLAEIFTVVCRCFTVVIALIFHVLINVFCLRTENCLEIIRQLTSLRNNRL